MAATSKCAPTKKTGKPKGPVHEDLALLCKALGHPARVRILRILIDKGACISGDLSEEFKGDLAQSTVSEHLRILKESGLVQGTVEGPGPRRCYCVDSDVVARLKELVGSL